MARRGRKARQRTANLDHIWQAFDPDTLRSVCQLPERSFAEAYDLDTIAVQQIAPSDFYAFGDNGSDVLAVAHLDTVSKPGKRQCNFLDTEAGTVVYSRALDDRLGAYVILDLLPKLGITCDVLLTVGEETGQSTASFFEPPKEYNWVIEFDRGGSDVVMYQFEDDDSADLVRESGATVGVGIFSDICDLEHLGVKAFNWGVGYQDYHTARSHAYLDDTFAMVSRFMDFHAVNADTRLPHTESYGRSLSRYDDDDEFRTWWAQEYHQLGGSRAGNAGRDTLGVNDDDRSPAARQHPG